MPLGKAPEERGAARVPPSLNAIAWEGARRMLAAAHEAEVAPYIEQARGERDARGDALVNRRGHARERQVTTVARVSR